MLSTSNIYMFDEQRLFESYGELYSADLDWFQTRSSSNFFQSLSCKIFSLVSQQVAHGPSHSLRFLTVSAASRGNQPQPEKISKISLLAKSLANQLRGFNETDLANMSARMCNKCQKKTQNKACEDGPLFIISRRSSRNRCIPYLGTTLVYNYNSGRKDTQHSKND